MLKLTATFPEMAKTILRVSTGGVFVYHGALKLFAPFGGKGMAGFTGYLNSLGILEGLGKCFNTEYNEKTDKMY